MAHAFFLGIDATEHEGTPVCTLSLVEKAAGAAEDDTVFRLDRLQQRTEPDVEALVDDVQNLLAERPYTARTALVVNRRHALGQQIYEALQARGPAVTAVTLTGGMGATAGTTAESTVALSEYDAIRALSNHYHRGRFDLNGRNTDLASRLAHGLQSFEAAADDEAQQETPTDLQDQPNRAEAHDSVVTATALATWMANERSFDPTRHFKEEATVRPGRATDLTDDPDLEPAPADLDEVAGPNP
jgi:hypothetical protein